MELTTTQLATETGIPAATLRMWQARYGFPTPSRTGGGGHRRYSEQDVEQVRAVIAQRREGLSLPAAIARVAHTQPQPADSIFAGLRARRPDLQPMVLPKPLLLALTRAIEDEHCARAAHGVLIGSFQRVHFYRQSERRWREFARTAHVAVALADFRSLRERHGAPCEVPFGRTHPLGREWSIVIDAPGAAACVVGWEIPEPRPTADFKRRFEVLFSPEPEVVRAVVSVAAELLAPLAPSIASRIEASLERPVRLSNPDLRAASALTHRMLEYLARLLEEPR